MKDTEAPEVITIGSHVIVQKLNFKKVYKVSETSTLTLGKEEIQMNEIIGKSYWSTYKVVGLSEHRDKRAKRSLCTLVPVEKHDKLVDLKNSVSSGYDNRSINDDGKSQKLSNEEILGFRESGKSGREIVSSLIENNASFSEKTEYSQEKYIKKKEKKYCQFLTILKPTLADVQEIYMRQDASKIYNMRMDALAQILTYNDVKSDGTFVLYDSGTAGLVPSAMLSRIGANTVGRLLYFHSGDHLPQIPIVRVLNLPQEQQDRMVIASIFDFLRMFNNKDSITKDTVKVVVKNEKVVVKNETVVVKNETVVVKNENSASMEETEDSNQDDGCHAQEDNESKRKHSESPTVEGPVQKKSRKVLEVERCVEIMSETKADSLTIVAKEHPLNIIKGLLPFMKSSRPFVIYHAHREPLEETYVALKQESDVINLRLFSNFLRSYQVLPDRTHPDVTTNDCGGYILTGYTGGVRTTTW